MLDNGDQDLAVERLKRAQEERVANGLAEIWPRPQGSTEVKKRVADEPADPREPDHGEYPEKGPRSERQREEPVVPGQPGQPGRGGEPAEGTQLALGRVQRIGGYGHPVRNHDRRPGDGAGRWTRGAGGGTRGVCV